MEDLLVVVMAFGLATLLALVTWDTLVVPRLRYRFYHKREQPCVHHWYGPHEALIMLCIQIDSHGTPVYRMTEEGLGE